MTRDTRGWWRLWFLRFARPWLVLGGLDFGVLGGLMEYSGVVE